MQPFFLCLSAVLVVLTCAVHSIVGEIRLIGPIMRQREGILASDLARQVLRFAWHFMTALGFLLAWFLINMGAGSMPVDEASVLLVGFVLVCAGVIDAIYTRGKHIGWPLIVASGGAALAALL